MSVVIRLARGGAKKRPFYRIVAADKRAPRDGRFIEKLGTYNPMLAKDSAERVQMNEERVKYWLAQGARPSERMEVMLFKAGLLDDAPTYKRRVEMQKKRDAETAKQKAEEEAKAAAEAKAAEEEAAKQAAEEAKSEESADAPAEGEDENKENAA